MPTSRLRIAHVLSRSAVGGGPSVVFTLMRSIQQIDQDVHQSVILPSGGGSVERFRSIGVETHELNVDRLLVSPTRVAEVVRSCRPDIVHSHGKGAGLHMRRTRSLPGRPVVVHSFHGFHPPTGGIARLAYIQLERFLAGRTARFICVSRSEAEEVQTSIPGSRRKVVVIPNQIDYWEAEQASRHPLDDAVGRWFGSNRGRRVITMVARPDPVKDHALACAWAHGVLESSDEYAFLFVGLRSDDPRVAALQQRAAGRVFSVESIVPATPAIGRSWALMLTSQKEGSPLVVLEGNALGVPTFGTRVPGISDVIDDGVTGFLLDRRPDALRNALERLRNDPSQFDSVVQEIRRRSAAADIREWALSYLRLYTEGGSHS